MSQIWRYRDEVAVDPHLDGFDVVAEDGEIGRVDEATYDIDASYVVVDTGPWIFGGKTLLPAGVIAHIDLERETVHVSRTRAEILQAPDFQVDRLHEVGYCDQFGAYYRT